MKIVDTFGAARKLRRGFTGVVPTMGFLHEGHLSLVRIARQLSETVIVTLFVNPLQFGPDDDLDRYPRDLDRDAALVETTGADVLFAPGIDEVYPTAPLTRVTVLGIAETMEGRRRPGHFAGVATVVAKLLAGLRPDLAVFGRKDAQQFAVVRRMALDLSFPVEMLAGPTIREADGLALSSRNIFLAPVERTAALALSRGLMAAADAAEAGEASAAVLEGIVAEELDREPLLDIDYVELADAAEVTRLVLLDRPAFLAAAARIGSVRLIDNVWLDPEGGADRGEWLEGDSVLYGGGD